MSTIEMLQNHIDTKVRMIASVKLELEMYVTRMQKLIEQIQAEVAVHRDEIALAQYVPPCYYCGGEDDYHTDGCYDSMEDEVIQEVFEPAAAPAPAPIDKQFFPNRCERMKLKWVSNSNHETYRVAIITKNGILQVKSVTDGAGECHNTHNCSCRPCREIRLSRGQLPPWLTRVPLKKTFFPTEAAWRASLPEGGSVTQHSPVTDRQLKKLLKPLTATTDALKLKELEERFPDSKMVFSTGTVMHEVAYMGDDTGNHRIFSNTTGEIRSTFSDFGMQGNLNLMVEWKGLYIGLEHLF